MMRVSFFIVIRRRIVMVEAKQKQGARIGERGVAKDTNSHEPERGGG